MSWEDIIKESPYFTKSKLRALLKLLLSDNYNDTEKVNQAIGFVNGMLKRFD